MVAVSVMAESLWPVGVPSLFGHAAAPRCHGRCAGSRYPRPVALSRTEEIGRVLAGRYRIIAPIGRGASGDTASWPTTCACAAGAVKMLHAALADDAAFLRRFQAEAQAAAALNHPNVMAVYDWGQDPDGDVPFLVLEYLGRRQPPLDARPRRHAHAEPDAARGARGHQALEYAHRRLRPPRHQARQPPLRRGGPPAHRRLRVGPRPGRGGLDRAAGARCSAPPAARSPEQAQGKALTGKADVYSLALVLVEAVTGRVPFTADTTIGTLMARVDRDLEVGDELGPLRSALARRPGRCRGAARRPRPGGRAHGGGSRDAPAHPLPLAGAVASDGPVDDSRSDHAGGAGSDHAGGTGSGPVLAAPVRPTPPDGHPARPEPAPATGDDDLEVWPFLNVTAATPATVAPEAADLDLTVAERTEDRTAALGSTVAGPPPPPPPTPTPTPPAGAEPFGDETAYVSPRPEQTRRSWRRWALIALVLALLVSVGVSAGLLSSPTSPPPPPTTSRP